MERCLTLSYDYSSACLKDKVILYNNLNGKVFTVEGRDANIIRDLINGTCEQNLQEKYGASWIALKKNLVRNSALISCGSSAKFFDTWDFGAIHVSSRDRSRVAILREVVVQYATVCSLDCPNCGDVLDPPCLGCAREHTPASLANETLINAVSYLRNHGLRQLTIAGADPLIRSKDLLELANEVKAVAPNVLICVRTNGTLIQSNPTLLKSWPRNAVLELLPIGERSCISKGLLQNLNSHGIRYVIARKGRKIGSEIDVRAEDLETSSTLETNTICAENMPCVFQRAYISANGNVSSCRGYSLRGQDLGNMLKDSLDTIIMELESSWKSEVSDRKKCSVCSWRSHCTVCPALRSAPQFTLHCESSSSDMRT